MRRSTRFILATVLSACVLQARADAAAANDPMPGGARDAGAALGSPRDHSAHGERMLLSSGRGEAERIAAERIAAEEIASESPSESDATASAALPSSASSAPRGAARAADRGLADRGLADRGLADRGLAGAGRGKPGTLSRGADRSVLDELLPTGLALGATLLVIVLSRSAIKRAGDRLGRGRRPQGVVEVLARYPVARGQQIVLLKVGRRVIVTHQCGQGMRALSEFNSEPDVADLVSRCEAGSRSAGAFSFDALLRQSSRVHEDAASGEGVAPAGPGSRATRSADARGGSARDAMPAFMRNAEIETVDLTRRRRGGGAA